MRDRPVINGEGESAADADRLDAARRVLLADYCRLVARRLNVTAGPVSGDPEGPAIGRPDDDNRPAEGDRPHASVGSNGIDRPTNGGRTGGGGRSTRDHVDDPARSAAGPSALSVVRTESSANRAAATTDAGPEQGENAIDSPERVMAGAPAGEPATEADAESTYAAGAADDARTASATGTSGANAAIAALALPRRLEQTLAALLAGRSEKQVARELTISPHTVHTYVKQLHKRLGVNSRGELLARFIERGR